MFFKRFFVSNEKERHEENLRKSFHLCGIIIPFMILYFTQTSAIILTISILIPVLIADYNNFALILKKTNYLNKILKLFRQNELIKGRLSGFSWLLIGILIIVTLFDKQIAALSVSILIISDACAALIGKNFGKIKLCGTKTLEGTIAFIVSGLATSFLFIKYILKSQFVLQMLVNTKTITIIFVPEYVCIAILLSAIVELVAKNIEINDNFAVPLSFCLTYKILTILF